eukprot:TRINITY_DN639_c0_g1_i3.p1 TRINITY_DN639_c0_g1~~TRINITY_DN639_c0_g1_i3.p1  ORF type:complete len:305 (+),score=-18.35 TRINITY_DN639_c0_g1_i3:273-1187(+)
MININIFQTIYFKNYIIYKFQQLLRYQRELPYLYIQINHNMQILSTFNYLKFIYVNKTQLKYIKNYTYMQIQSHRNIQKNYQFTLTLKSSNQFFIATFKKIYAYKQLDQLLRCNHKMVQNLFSQKYQQQFKKNNQKIIITRLINEMLSLTKLKHNFEYHLIVKNKSVRNLTNSLSNLVTNKNTNITKLTQQLSYQMQCNFNRLTIQNGLQQQQQSIKSNTSRLMITAVFGQFQTVLPEEWIALTMGQSGSKQVHIGEPDQPLIVSQVWPKRLDVCPLCTQFPFRHYLQEQAANACPQHLVPYIA